MTGMKTRNHGTSKGERGTRVRLFVIEVADTVITRVGAITSMDADEMSLRVLGKSGSRRRYDRYAQHQLPVYNILWRVTSSKLSAGRLLGTKPRLTRTPTGNFC